jgi:tetratricopeptide (TPR) repeat protein
MSEQDFIAAIKARWPVKAVEATQSKELLALVDEATKSHENSAVLWTMRGDLLQLLESDYPLKESEQCYRRAIKADPRYAEAYEEMGRFLEFVMSKPRKAKRFLEKASRLRNAKPNNPLQPIAREPRAPG